MLLNQLMGSVMYPIEIKKNKRNEQIYSKNIAYIQNKSINSMSQKILNINVTSTPISNWSNNLM